jgi:hypothetical protein
MQEYSPIKEEINIDDVFDGSRGFTFTEEEKSLLTDLSISQGYKVFEKFINILALNALDASLSNVGGFAEYNRGRARAYFEMKRELKLLARKYLKKK